MAQSYEHKTKIDSRDVDGLGHCRASALLGHLQEAATQAGECGGFGREVMRERHNGFWMLTRMWYQLARPLKWGEEITIHTWHRGGKGAVSYRDYDIYDEAGDRIGEGVSGWVMVDYDSHRLIRLSTVTEMATTHGGDLCKSKTLNKIKAPDEMEVIGQRQMLYSDTDINGHVNNTRYADFACDALEMEKLPKGWFLAEMQIGYLAECLPGEVLDIWYGEAAEDCRYISGRDEQGKARFEVSVQFAQETSE